MKPSYVPYERSIILDKRSILIYLCMHFLVKIFSLSIRYGAWTVDRYSPCPPRVDHFHQKVESYSRCFPSICAIGLLGFHIFALKFSLDHFFPKKVVNFNLLRQNKHDKIHPIISYKWHNFVNTHTKSVQMVLQSPQKNTTRSLPTSFRTLVRRYLFENDFNIPVVHYLTVLKNLVNPVQICI